MTRNPLACASCPVRARAACAALGEGERIELARLGQRRTVQRGETVFAAGDRSSSYATLVSGALKISSLDADGTERIVSLVHPAGFIGEMFSAVARHDITALADSELCVFPSDKYAQAIERFPALARALLQRTSEELFASRSLIDLISRRPARQRVATFLLSMARAASDSPCHPAGAFDLPLTRGEMADFLGLTIETVSRQLGALESDRLIDRSGRRGIRLLDVERLEAAAA